MNKTSLFLMAFALSVYGTLKLIEPIGSFKDLTILIILLLYQLLGIFAIRRTRTNKNWIGLMLFPTIIAGMLACLSGLSVISLSRLATWAVFMALSLLLGILITRREGKIAH